MNPRIMPNHKRKRSERVAFVAESLEVEGLEQELKKITYSSRLRLIDHYKNPQGSDLR